MGNGGAEGSFAAATAFVLSTAVCLAFQRSRGHDSKRLDLDQMDGDPRPMAEVRLVPPSSARRCVLAPGSITIVHGSMTGTCRRFAEQLEAMLSAIGRDIQVVVANELDWWDELLNAEELPVDEARGQAGEERPPWLILLLPTYSSGTWSPSSQPLNDALHELMDDWRIPKHFLREKKLQIAVFGMGSSAYPTELVGKPAKEALRMLTKLGAKNRVRLAIGDDALGNHAQDAFHAWSRAVSAELELPTTPKRPTGRPTVSEPSYDEYSESDEEDDAEPQILDVEDMGDSILNARRNNESDPSEPPEMVTPSQAKALTKEGYQLIGSHSAVKLCRWTKHQLRGRGGCYKHTFYGITSYQCMEATPSLACANKCVFCWRHHKNPVGKEWKWKTDDPKFIVDEAISKHVQLIRQAQGIPGVHMDRWREALTPRHCALSLVGEPIMYPHINKLLGELHSRQISTFLVTNGQHPNAIQALIPITQLYVSVDAPNKQSLIEIDRPLFNDAWDRLRESLSCLKSKGQRTVARLTVVKGWNSDDVAGYAQLIALGKVSLVEVKGVTFCGKSDASNLNMTNTPWHHEVVDITRALRDELRKLRAADSRVPEYDLACEHKHSCSVLLARVDQFRKIDQATGESKWYTWINYERFQQLAARQAGDASFCFGVEDYTAETPSWALFGANEEGFDPSETRFRKRTKHPMYMQFDERGVPTHDCNNIELTHEERQRLLKIMDERMEQCGSGTTVTELPWGEKEVHDASLIFRGLVVTK